VHSESIRFDSEAWLEEIDGWSPSVESLVAAGAMMVPKGWMLTTFSFSPRKVSFV
jgi:hypothetical protein